MNPPRSLFLVLVLILAGASVLAAQERTERAQRTEGKSSAQKGQSESKSAQKGTTQQKTTKKPEKVVRTEKEWRKILTRQQFKVLRSKGTEPAFRNKYDKHFDAGTYACAACGQELFASGTKFNSGCGWPAFYTSMAGDRVNLAPDYTMGMVRTEVTCARCDSHLGHVFRDAPRTPTGNRFCINSVSLKFIPAESKDKKAKRKSSESRKEAESKSKSRTGKKGTT